MDSVLRGVAVYVILLVVLRLSGRRAMSDMSAFDFVLLLIVAETTQQALLGDDFSITNSAILIITLFTADVLLSLLKGWSPRVQRILDGSPTVLISRGEPDLRALRRARVSLDEVMEAARSKHGLARIDQIRFAILEARGTISIVPDGPEG
jgi:uncharacterized membrane protein YcaP (DUF421 family)